MALTESTMLELGADAPEFDLPATDGSKVSLSDFQGKPLLVMFICNHCPYVVHVASELAKIGKDYAATELGIVAISSNDASEYPADSFDKMKEEAVERGYSFPYLYDETQQVAIAFTAACTPDFFLFDAQHRLVYRGQLDRTRPTRIRSGVYDSTGNEPTGENLRAAINAVLMGDTPHPEKQLPSMGCNIKWKQGNEPDYFK